MPLKNPELTKYTTASQVIATYNFNDIAEGTGSTNFYLSISKDSVGTDYFLTANTGTKSSSIRSDASPTSPFLEWGDAENKTFTFDLSQFNFPKNIEGQAFFSVNYYISNTGNNATDFQPTFTLYHYDGTTETSLGAVTTEAQNPTVIEPHWGTFLCSINITNKYFATGDILRLKINYSAGNPTDIGTRRIYCDPANRTPTYGNADSFVSVPFRIEQ